MREVLCFLLFSCCCWAGPARGSTAVLPETARLVPPETVLLVNIDNFNEMRAAFERTNFYRLYRDPAMAGFVEEFKKKCRERMQKAGNKVAEGIFSTDMLPQGRVGLALVLDEQAIALDKPRFLLITQWGDSISKIKEAVDETVKAAVERGLHRTSEEYRGVTIVTMIKEAPTEKVPETRSLQPDGNSGLATKTRPSPELTHYCYIDDCLIVCDNIDVLKFVLAHIKGATSSTLAGETDYNAGKRAVGPYHDIDVYVNIKQIMRAAIAGDRTGQARTMVGNLGFDNVASFSMSVGFGRQAGVSCVGKALLKINGAKKGICRMLESESAPFRAPRFVSGSACSLVFFNLNMRKAYEDLGNILNSFSPKSAAWMYTPLPTSTSPDEPGLRIRQDIVDHLGSQIVMAQSVNKPFSTDSRPTESIVALAVNNRKELEKSLSLLHGKLIAANRSDMRRDLLGHTIYLVAFPGLPFFKPGAAPMQGPAGPKMPQRPTLAFALTDTHLIFGAESAVERAIRALNSVSNDAVDSAKWFTSAKSAIPSTAGLVSLQDHEASSELSWQMMKESAADGQTDSGRATVAVGMNSSFDLLFSEAGLDLFDFSLLPNFDAVRKYFGLSASYGVSRPDGFFFEFKYLAPTGNN